MSKKMRIANVYTGLFAGAVSGWFLHKLVTKPPARTTVGAGAYRFPADTDYDRGWNDGVDGNSSVVDSGQASAQYLSGYRAAAS